MDADGREPEYRKAALEIVPDRRGIGWATRAAEVAAFCYSHLALTTHAATIISSVANVTIDLALGTAFTLAGVWVIGILGGAIVMTPVMRTPILQSQVRLN